MRRAGKNVSSVLLLCTRNVANSTKRNCIFYLVFLRYSGRESKVARCWQRNKKSNFSECNKEFRANLLQYRSATGCHLFTVSLAGGIHLQQDMRGADLGGPKEHPNRLVVVTP